MLQTVDCASENVPGLHWLHPNVVLVVYLPSGHVMQLALLLEPTPVEYVPAGHTKHVPELVARIVVE